MALGGQQRCLDRLAQQDVGHTDATVIARGQAAALRGGHRRARQMSARQRQPGQVLGGQRSTRGCKDAQDADLGLLQLVETRVDNLIEWVGQPRTGQLLLGRDELSRNERITARAFVERREQRQSRPLAQQCLAQGADLVRVQWRERKALDRQ